MKGHYQLLGEMLGDCVTGGLGLLCFFAGLYFIFTKNEKVKNKKRGLFLSFAGGVLFVYHLIKVILYFCK